MSDDQQIVTIEGIKIEGNEALGDLLTGFADVLMAFGVTFANAGLIKRADLAATMARALDQLKRQPNNTRSRRYPLESMLAVFSAPTMTGGVGTAGLVPIEGGKKDETPPDQ